LRFALLQHTGWPGREDHFDILLQLQPAANPNETSLLSFATEVALPPVDGSRLLRLALHRQCYLDFEGALSQGRGYVLRYDAGSLRWANCQEGAWRFSLYGKHLSGEYRIAECSQGGYRWQKRVIEAYLE
jgi:hypothetical protein